jgi:hypothetical protein
MTALTLADLAADAPRWDGAACVDRGDLFFVDEFSGTSAVAATEEAKRICTKECSIRETCLAWAIEQRIPFGVFGGLTADERGTALLGYCRTCAEPIPGNRSKARYCPTHRHEIRAEQNRNRT